MVHRPTTSGLTRSPFPPIADYGFLSDCETTALVAPDGSVEWLCLPRMDSPSVFGALLDRDAGWFRLGPTGVKVPAGRRYLPGTMVLETSWGTKGGWVVVRDALLIGPWHHSTDRSKTHRRTPTDYDADHVLLRTVRCVNGEVQLGLACEPVFDYGASRVTWAYDGEAYKSAVARAPGSDVELRITTDMNLGIEGPRVTGRHLIKAGEAVYAALSWSEHAAPKDFEEAYERLVWTAHHWQHWLDRGNFPDHPWAADLQRAALTLKGLTYAPTGAIVAAATTSLPETAGGERNWDYRYSWIRDSSLTLEALYIGTCSDEAEEFVSFMTSSAGGGESLPIMYGIRGDHDLTERELPHLRGWRDSSPVRAGNGAWNQTQLDVYGELLDALHLYREQLGELHPEIQEFAARLADAAAERWSDKDAGMWEMRGEPRHHLSSKVLCWVALDRAVKLAPALGEFAKEDEWAAERDRVREAILERGWSDARGAFTQSFESDELDAAALVMPIVGFLPATDERMRSTIEAIARELSEGGLVLRYRNEVGLNADGLEGEEGTFVICSFWLVSCLAKAGQHARAEQLFDRLAGYANDLGLLAEEIDTATGEQLGNFPQAFSHIGLITAANGLDRRTVAS